MPYYITLQYRKVIFTNHQPYDGKITILFGLNIKSQGLIFSSPQTHLFMIDLFIFSSKKTIHNVLLHLFVIEIRLIMIIALAMNICQITHSPKQCYITNCWDYETSCFATLNLLCKSVNHYCFYLLKYSLHHKLLEVCSKASLCKY